MLPFLGVVFKTLLIVWKVPYPCDSILLVFPFERWLASQELVSHYAYRPDIGLIIVHVTQNFGRHVQGATDRECFLALILLHHTRKSEVGDLTGDICALVFMIILKLYHDVF